MKKITNVVEAQNELLATYENFKAGKLSNAAMQQVNNTHGKVTGYTKLQIEHQKLLRISVPIPFLLTKEVAEELKLKKATNKSE